MFPSTVDGNCCTQLLSRSGEAAPRDESRRLSTPRGSGPRSCTPRGNAQGPQTLAPRSCGEPAPAPESRKFRVPRGPDLAAWTPRGCSNCSQTLGDRGGPTDALDEATSLDPKAVTGRTPSHARRPRQGTADIVDVVKEAKGGRGGDAIDDLDGCSATELAIEDRGGEAVGEVRARARLTGTDPEPTPNPTGPGELDKLEVGSASRCARPPRMGAGPSAEL